MPTKNRFLIALALCGAIAFGSCKKSMENSDTTTDVATTAALSIHSDDQILVSSEVDAITDDANVVIENNPSFNGREDNTLGALCNATSVMDSTNDIRKITITYNGLNCSGDRSFSGKVLLTMPKAKRWKDSGAVMTVTLQQLKITRVKDNKSITLNGTKTITNVTGGRLRDLALKGSIKFNIIGTDLSVTFGDSTTRIWQVAKQRAYSYNNGLVITTTGLHTDGATTGIAEWGTNRAGKTFATAITAPLVVRQDCSFRVVSGQVMHTKLATQAVVTFGLNAAGEATNCPGTGSYYCKMVWTGANGMTKTKITAY